MKKTMRIFVLAVALMLALCCSAQAITQSEIQGVWDVDVKELLLSQGLEAADVEAVLAIVDMSMTIEFTADQKMIMKTDAAGEVSTEEYAYTLTGDYIVADDMRSTLKRTGNELTMKDPDGTTIVMTLHGAGAAPVAPAADNGIVGVWDLDIMAVMKMSGASDEEIAEMEPLMGLMSATMEFTADGRCIMVVSALGEETNREEMSYSVEGNTLYMNGSPNQFVLEGNTLKINGAGGMDLTLTK